MQVGDFDTLTHIKVRNIDGHTVGKVFHQTFHLDLSQVHFQLAPGLDPLGSPGNRHGKFNFHGLFVFDPQKIGMQQFLIHRMPLQVL